VTTAVGKDGRATLPDALNQPAKSGAGQAAPASAPDGNATAWTIASGGAALNDMKLTLAGNEPTSPVRMASLKVGPVSVNTGAQAVNIGAVALSLAVEVERLRPGQALCAENGWRRKIRGLDAFPLAGVRGKILPC
jgi:hypothetical protein